MNLCKQSQLNRLNRHLNRRQYCLYLLKLLGKTTSRFEEAMKRSCKTDVNRIKREIAQIKGVMKLRREVKFISGYDCIKFKCKFNSERCYPGSGGSHGVHGLEIRFYVHGEKGAVQFVLSTGWKPQYIEPDKIRHLSLSNCFDNCNGMFPMATDLGYHSYKPHYEGQTPIENKCEVLGGKTCYYDGSSLNCNDAFYTLLNGGEDKLWEFLEQYYKCVFEGDDYPKVTEYPVERR